MFFLKCLTQLLLILSKIPYLPIVWVVINITIHPRSAPSSHPHPDQPGRYPNYLLCPD